MEQQKYSLKELRARKNWTQKRVAREQTYNAWEKDISNVAVSKVNAVAILFGVTLDQIFFAQGHENNSCRSKKGEQ